jgi:hypothetical protein
MLTTVPVVRYGEVRIQHPERKPHHLLARGSVLSPQGKTEMLSLAARYAALVVFALVFAAPRAMAHCDSLDGPVVQDARKALEKADATPVLKWVQAQYEDEILSAFQRTMAARAASEAARIVADQYFFETLVRIHRAGEGEPFTGLKPANAVEPGIEAADDALESGSVEELATEVSAAVREGIAKRFNAVVERRKGMAASVDQGRQFVDAYVDYIHFVENVHRLATHGVASHQHESDPSHSSSVAR